MAKLKGSEIILDHLIGEGVPYLFGLCGHGDIGLMDAAYDRQNQIRMISVHNEQIAGFMADAYFRVSRRPVATFTSCGPGSVNIQMPIASAYSDSSAIFAITGNIPTQQFNRGPFQELGAHYQADFPSAMKPYVKRSYQATRVDMLPDMMRHAYSTMLAGRPGPVNLDVPFNIFLEEAEVTAPDPKAWHTSLPVRAQGDPAAIEAALDLLFSAKRPLILAGQGSLASTNHSDLRDLAVLLGVPVATTPQGKGAFDETDDHALGPTGRDGVYPANRASRECDVLLALGTRFGDRGASGWVDGATHSIPPTKLIHVDIEATQIGKNYPTAIGIVGDVALVVRQLMAAAKARGLSAISPSWLARTADWKRVWRSDLQRDVNSEDIPCHPDRVMADLRKVIPGNAIMLSDIGAHHSWMVQQWSVTPPAQLLQSGGFACMGFGVGGALGAQLAAPERPVVAVVGDGGFLMHASAVATAVEYDLPVVWIVWNNCGYVSIRDMQNAFFGREIATRFRRARTGELHSTDFAMLARSMGAVGMRVERAQDFSAMVEEAVASRKPTVIDLPVKSDIVRRTSGSWDLVPLAGKPPNYDPDPVRR
ncbi:thiamine pyrophosphate-binding protein [Pseudorhodoplanes sp.]|uniref:thiamine pyrophosphate-binding protein n=1 Tax=Pseudorhodoplanes sp. TaxID=1934341 RepID=UPI003D098A26